jgi:hypothetical protein
MSKYDVVIHQKIMHGLERYRFRQFDQALDILCEGCLTEEEDLRRAAKMIAKFEERPFTEDKGFKY